MDTRSRTLLGGPPEIPQVPIGDGLDTPGSQNIIRTFSPLGRPHDSVVGGTLGLFVGFSFADVIILLMTCFQKVHDQIKKRIRVDKITPYEIIEIKERSEKLTEENTKQ